MPRILALRFHTYSGEGYYLGISYDPPLSPEEALAIPAETREQRKATEHEYEIGTWLDGPREGEETIIFRAGYNMIPAWWPVRASRAA